MMKKLLLPAALLCVLCAAVSCGDSAASSVPADTAAGITEAEETTAAAETEEDRGYPAPETDDLDFGGEAIRFRAMEWGTHYYCFADELDGDAVNDAIYERQRKVSEALNVTIEYELLSYDDELEAVKKTALSGDDAFDAVYTHCIGGISDFVTSGYLYNWDDLPYVDFDAPWWDKSMIDSYRIGSNTYYATGDATIQNVTLVLFNKSIAEEYDMPSFYQEVRDGKWTIDSFLGYAREVSVDVNGDGVIDDSDKTGYSGDLTEALCAIPFGCGIKLSESTDDGIQLAFYSDKTVTLFEKVFDFFTDSNVSRGYFRGNGEGQDFSDGLSLFSISFMRSVPGLRDSDVDFGILPMPKYDEAQESYYSYGWNTFLCVMSTITRPELVGAALEQWAYESEDVLDAYNETLIKSKSARDEESLEMINIANDTIVYDIASNYLGFDANVTELFYAFSRQVLAGKNTFSSMYEKKEKACQKALDKLYESVIAQEQK